MKSLALWFPFLAACAVSILATSVYVWNRPATAAAGPIKLAPEAAAVMVADSLTRAIYIATATRSTTGTGLLISSATEAGLPLDLQVRDASGDLVLFGYDVSDSEIKSGRYPDGEHTVAARGVRAPEKASDVLLHLKTRDGARYHSVWVKESEGAP